MCHLCSASETKMWNKWADVCASPLFMPSTLLYCKLQQIGIQQRYSNRVASKQRTVQMDPDSVVMNVLKQPHTICLLPRWIPSRLEGAVDSCVLMPSGCFKRTWRCHISWSALLNLVALLKQLIPSDLISTLHVCRCFCKCTGKCVCASVSLWSKLNCATLASEKKFSQPPFPRTPKTQLQPPITPLSSIRFVSHS